VYKNDIGIFALSKEHTFELQDEVLRWLEKIMALQSIHSNVNGWFKKQTG
jgi:hypothetical protein